MLCIDKEFKENSLLKGEINTRAYCKKNLEIKSVIIHLSDVKVKGVMSIFILHQSPEFPKAAGRPM